MDTTLADQGGGQSGHKERHGHDAKVTDEDCFSGHHEGAGSIAWPVRMGFSLCMWTLALCCTQEEPNLHLEFYLRDVADGMRSSWNLSVGVV